MFAVPPRPEEGDLRRLRRTPVGAWRLIAQGWSFLPENRQWDADERELVARATGLFQISPTGWVHDTDHWFKAFARAYARYKNLNLALGECAGVESRVDLAAAERKTTGADGKSTGPICRRLSPEEIQELRRSGREKAEQAMAAFRTRDG